ncbi:hypothetical protein GIB67_001690, partial [Kingdonia uniflora]
QQHSKLSSFKSSSLSVSVNRGINRGKSKSKKIKIEELGENQNQGIRGKLESSDQASFPSIIASTFL